MLSLDKLKWGGLFVGASLATVSNAQSISETSLESNNERSELEEIVVTAQRREGALQDTPIAVTAITNSELQARGIGNVSDLQDIAPNLSISDTAAFSGSTSTAVVFIRGIGQTDFALTTESGVGVYIDEVYTGRSIGALLDLGDVAQIEVLRGPQGTLFGKNTIGGALNITTKRPELREFYGDVEFTAGSFDRFDGRASLNIPINDSLAMRVSAASLNYDGYAKRVVAGDRLGGRDTLAGKLSMLFEPNERFSALLTADLTSTDGDSTPTTLLGLTDGVFIAPGQNEPTSIGAVAGLEAGLGLAPGTLTFEEFSTDSVFETKGIGPNFVEDDVWGVSLQASYELSDSMSLKSITAYRSVESEFGRDAYNLPFQPTSFTQDEYEQKQFTQELQLSGSAFDQRLDWIVGAFFLSEDGRNRNFVGFNDALLGFGAAPTATLNSGGLIENESVAIFGEVSYEFTDRFGAFFGLRYSDEDKTFDTRGFQNLVEIPELLLAPQTKIEESYDDVSPRIGVDYKFDNGNLLYASYSKGFKGGGFVQRVFPGLLANPGFEITPYGPETAGVYEVGLKTELLDNRLRLNTAIFSSDYKDVQISVRETPMSFTPQTVNGGEVEIYGFESEFFAVPTNWLTLNGSIGYLDASYKSVDSRATQVTLSSKLPYTSDWTASLGAQTRIYEGGKYRLLARADLAYRSSFFTQAANDPITEQDSYSLLNLTATLEIGEQITIQGGVTNATDEEYLLGATSSLNTLGFAEGNYAAPRQYYIQSRWSF